MVHNTTAPDIETASDDYHGRFAGPVGAYFLEVQQQAIGSCLASLAPQGLKILEVGGGHGQLTEALLKAGHEVWVHGSADSCFNRVKRLESEYSGRIHFVCSPLWEIPFPNASFDLVIAVRLLAHVERWQELLSEMARLATQAIIFDFPVRSALNALTPWLFGVKRKIEGNTRPYFSYALGELDRELRKLGLRPDRARRQFFFPMGLHRALRQPGVSRLVEALARRLGLTANFGSPVVLAARKS